MAGVRSWSAQSAQLDLLTCGVGPVEAAISLTRHLASQALNIFGVIHFGIAGGYEGGAEVLDLCLATKESFGDIGICFLNDIISLEPAFAPPTEFLLDPNLLEIAAHCLAGVGFDYRLGPFVTVAGVSGTGDRGKMLRTRFGAICENMEGASVARVCELFQVPCLEIRCVSNSVIDRKSQVWQTEKAIHHCQLAVKHIVEELLNAR